MSQSQQENSSRDKRWSLQGMTALVTGGTKGLGYAVVGELAALGAIVHTCGRSQEQLRENLREWKAKGFKVTGSVCDLSSNADREKLMEEVSSFFDGKLDILLWKQSWTRAWLLSHSPLQLSHQWSRPIQQRTHLLLQLSHAAARRPNTKLALANAAAELQ
nr:tropinone reductase homolog At2g29150-like isoform X2 [Populus alba]